MVASQQPAPIPDDLKKDHEFSVYFLGNYNGGISTLTYLHADRKQLIERIARLEAALRKVQEKTSPHEGGVNMISKINAIARAALATPLGTPGKGEK